MSRRERAVRRAGAEVNKSIIKNWFFGKRKTALGSRFSGIVLLVFVLSTFFIQHLFQE